MFDDKKWNQIVASQDHAPFLQSVEWREFQRTVGREVVETVSGDKGITGVCSAFRHNIPGRQKYWYVPRGPVGEGVQSMMQSVLDHAREDGALFVRVDPVLGSVRSKEAMPIDSRLGPASDECCVTESQKIACAPVRSLQPRHTLILDLSLGEEQLLAAMHSKTRYNIRLAQKHEVVVKKFSAGEDGADEALVQFVAMLAKTTERDGFAMHETSYYQKLFHGFAGAVRSKTAAQVVLYLAYKDHAPIAGSLVMSFGDTVTYLHGASASESRELMAPYLVQWQAITEAMVAGYRHYDFCGIAPEGVLDHPWAGVTRFKKGFGGTELVYPESYDMILRPWWYRAYRLSQKLRGRG